MENIINITVIDRDGAPHELEVPTDMGLNLMEVCKSYELPVEGTCGGMALCASCHCFIDSNHETGNPSTDEEAMLDEVDSKQENSRLGCQIPIKSSLDGLVIKLAPELIPESQLDDW